MKAVAIYSKLSAVMLIMTVAIVTACQKEPVFLADVTYPEGVADNKIVVEARAGEFPLEIKTEGSWRVESDSFFFNVDPVEGSGNATVTVSVQNNTRSKRKTGHLTIVFPDHEEQNKTLTIEQKWVGEYDENADILDNLNMIYAVGYGYDTTKGLYANTDCLRAEIFNTSKLIKEKAEGTSGVEMETEINTVTGNSISELSNKLTAKANVKGGIGKFKAEANGSFTMDYHDNSNHEYAINYLEATLKTARFTKSLARLKSRENMNAEAYEDINGLYGEYVEYFSDGTRNEDCFKNLIRDYGTHVVVMARLGGRVRQSLDVDITNIKESYDLHAFAKASYEGTLVSADASVEDDFHKSYEKHKNSMKINVNVLGGNQEKATAFATQGGFTPDNYKAWLHSVDDDNMVLTGFTEESLIPLYELVDQNATVKKDGFDGKARYNALRSYMTGKEGEESQAAKDYVDNSTYDTGTVIRFNVPSFADNQDFGKTLVKDLMLGGQLVGQICEEYIPTIDRTKRLTVIYPVIGAIVRYNMGFFIGDDTHKPARVAWNGTTTNIEEYPDLKFGQVKLLYMRGASITTTPAEGASIQDGTLQDEYLTGLYYYHEGSNYQPENATNKPYDYPLVKIFDKVWTRIDYSHHMEGNRLNYYPVESFKDYQGKRFDFAYVGNAYFDMMRQRQDYPLKNVEKAKEFPAGWRVASMEDYDQMETKLGANGWSLPALALLPGQVTGFDLICASNHHDGDLTWWTEPDCAYYITPDGYLIEIARNGSIKYHQCSTYKKVVGSEVFGPDYRMPIRLVKQNPE